ncbi:MAG: hypothetical protein GC185_13065 [Alphaproteobacteria bacterium]|nr:hypothetical protein [Alphaproteobacteria bacterium]
MKYGLSILLLCVFGFLGGVASDQFMRHVAAADAPYRSEKGGVRYLDGTGRLRLDIGTFNGQAVQDMYGDDGKLRLQFGTYDGSVRPSEKGLPSMTLYDNDGRLRMLFRLDGPNQGPLIIMKDKRGRDRIIFGLDLWSEDEDPFLAVFDKNGRKQDVIGRFTMKPL